MTEIKASLKYLKIAPRKVMLVADLVRGVDVNRAKAILKFQRKRAAGPILKLLNSAIANAKTNFQFSEDELRVKGIKVNQGPMLKRWMPRAKGRATMIQKKSSHIDLILEAEGGRKEDKKKALLKEEAKKISETSEKKSRNESKPRSKIRKVMKEKETPKKIKTHLAKPVTKKVFRRKSI